MTTREEAIKACMTLPDVFEDYPFDGNWTVMRHRENRKSFAFIFQREEKIWINVKAEPMWGELWQGAYEAVVPAYHMNKRHWISIILDGTMEDKDILRLISDSFFLTSPGKTKKCT